VLCRPAASRSQSCSLYACLNRSRCPLSEFGLVRGPRQRAARRSHSGSSKAASGRRGVQDGGEGGAAASPTPPQLHAIAGRATTAHRAQRHSYCCAELAVAAQSTRVTSHRLARPAMAALRKRQVDCRPARGGMVSGARLDVALRLLKHAPSEPRPLFPHTTPHSPACLASLPPLSRAPRAATAA
jgi:hypothetical protein